MRSVHFWIYSKSGGEAATPTPLQFQPASGPKRTGAKVTLVPKEVTSCICAPKSSEYLTYMNTTTQGFHNVNDF